MADLEYREVPEKYQQPDSEFTGRIVRNSKEFVTYNATSHVRIHTGITLVASRASPYEDIFLHAKNKFLIFLLYKHLIGISYRCHGLLNTHITPIESSKCFFKSLDERTCSHSSIEIFLS